MPLKTIIAALLGLLFALPELEYFLADTPISHRIHPISQSLQASVVPEIDVSSGLPVLALLLCVGALVYRKMRAV